jgi:hypothetical protein
MDSVYNNTFVPLNAGDIWQGKSESVGKFDVAMVSCITDTSGVLHLSFSQDNEHFDFVETYAIRGGEPFVINQKIIAKWFFAELINDTSGNQNFLRLTTVFKNDIRSDLDIRHLQSTKDTITIPALSDCIVDNKLVVSVESVTVSGVTVDISGQRVDINGETVKSQIYDYNNYAITSQLIGSKRGLDVNNIGTVKAYEGSNIREVGAFTDSHNQINLRVYDDALNDKVNNTDIIGEDTGAIKVFITNTDNRMVNCDISGQRVDISGQTIIVSGGIDISGQRVDISGQTVDISGQRVDISGGRVDISGQRVDISGQRVLVDISGQKVDISGQRVLVDISGQKVDISGQRVLVDISGQRVLVDISGQRVVTDISGQTVLVDISGQRVDISGQTIIVSGKVDISGQRVVTDISGQTVLVDISGQRIDISGSRVDISGQRIDISGQRIDISGQTIIVSGGIDISGQRVDISGQRVDISGQTIIVSGRVDISGQRVLVDISGQRVDISGQTIIVSGNVDISGQRVVTDISGQRVDISGSRVDISGQRVVTDISGQRVLVDISGQRVDISGQTIIVSGGIDISGQRVDISGERVDISGQRVDISGQRVDISGSRVDISGQRVDISGERVDISGQRVDISGQSIIVTSMPPITVTADISGQRVDIDGETINSRCYASSNGTTWHHLSSDANGQLNIHSKTQDGNGTDITSTLVSAKQGLDVNVIGSSVVPIGGFDGSVTVALRAEGTSNNLRVAPYINNSAVGATTTTVVGQAGKYGMNSFITNTVNEPVAIGAMDASGNFRNIRTDNSANLLVNVANTVPISGSVSLAGSSAVQITNGTINAGITSTIANVASSNGLVANAVNYALTNTGTVSPVTSLINGAKNQLETRDNDAVAELTTIDNKIVQGYNTTNDGGVIGLNINQIRPKIRYYNMRGRSTVADVQMMMGSVGNSRYFTSDNFGKANVKTWWAYSESVSRTITYEYVDASGNESASSCCGVNLDATTITE